MINKKLINLLGENKKLVIANIMVQWIILLFNIIFIYNLAKVLANAYYAKSVGIIFILISLGYIAIKICGSLIISKINHKTSDAIKIMLRNKIFNKLNQLKHNYQKYINTAELVQITIEGVEQLDVYYSLYLPQFGYSLLAPLTLFMFISFFSLKIALILFVAVFIIPLSIVIVQKIAKRLLKKYWSKYTTLGNSFLENLQGMTTLKVFNCDELMNEKMNQEAENFRKITMKVLIMQLNSISIMDLVAYGGSALGIYLAYKEYNLGNIELYQCLLIILLSSEFFIPMRLLGSYFHIAMNGISSSEKILNFIGIQEESSQTVKINHYQDIELKNVYFNYEEKEILKGIDLLIKDKEITAIVGKSGSGKSTIASLLMKKNQINQGEILISNKNLNEIDFKELNENITYIGSKSYIFKGTIKDNLLVSKKDAKDEELLKVLTKVNLLELIDNELGLLSVVEEGGSNLSGGQCQRLALARALLHDSKVYIFDEATSNVDVESENIIMKNIYDIKKDKTIILISHRLENVEKADMIYLLENGIIKEKGNQAHLLALKGKYHELWNAQKELEKYRGEEND